ncbi:outer membrane protein OmpA-like peptidoglycan-associated protein [Mesorhizobium soli]|uniref:OmpA family protein n=1 Tax=Pseudaminobacter soli (ex Li et al. 2025) TaxID=1295366 RepID=UPI002473680E|nr:OmpA family protein [Mesorhizobium soli]MDH6232344.1 outer membrane protein OmpA-like peptidoglycan-associated protein [Mesorhizobium soli]
MKRQPKILAGTALSLLMAYTPLAAAPVPAIGGFDSPRTPLAANTQAPVLLAQAEEGQPQEQQPSEEAQPRKKHRQAEEAQQPAPEAGGGAAQEEAQPRKKHRQAQEGNQPGAEAAPMERAPAEEPAQPRKKERRQPAEQPAATQEFAPAPSEAPAEAPVRKKKHSAEQPAATQEFAPAPAEAPAEAPTRKKKHAAEQPAATQEFAPAPAEAPAEAPVKPRKKGKEAPAAEQPAFNGEAMPGQAEQPAEASPKKHKRDGKAAPAAEQPAFNGEVAPGQAEQPADASPKKHKKDGKAAPAAEQSAPTGEAIPAPDKKPAASDVIPSETAPAAQPTEATPEKPRKKGGKEAPVAEQPAPTGETAPAPAEKPVPTEAAPTETAPVEQPNGTKPDKPRKKGDHQAPAGEQPAAPGEAVTPGQPAQIPAEGEGNGKPVNPAKEAPVPGQEKPAQGEATGEGNAAPDSQKVAPGPDSQKAGSAEGQDQGAQGQGQGKGGQWQGGNRRPKPAEEAGPPPTDDRSAQQEVQPEKIVPVTSEQGKRVKERPVDLRRQERPQGTEILKEFGDRVIIQLNNQVMVESNERPRMRHGARDVYYEDLPRGRNRETIERGDGTRVVTIRNSYGDVVRRSRIMPDGHEYVLSYVDENDYDRVRDWRDPGDDLPPLRLEIPEDDYVLTPERVRDPDMYYDFLEQPPVERVERLYSIDEVKRSARIRDKTRRIDLDTINFEFGSAAVAENEISHLEGVANAMERILKQNPAETFLIEGHTDAVGSELANLALSDKRAESVAAALTNVFGIPPENLATQGYGKQFLKVKTQAPERQNRRVVIRRITPLVAPVASR